jgi:hypothetical protein
MQNARAELLRIPVPRTSVNKPSLDAPSFFCWQHQWCHARPKG